MQQVPDNISWKIRNLIEMLSRPNSFVVVLVGLLSASVLALLANAQISPDFPNPIAAPNPLTKTPFIFSSNMRDKIMKSAEAMPESKYSYRPTRNARSFGEILIHVGDISYYLCANAKGENGPVGRDVRRKPFHFSNQHGYHTFSAADLQYPAKAWRTESLIIEEAP